MRVEIDKNALYWLLSHEDDIAGYINDFGDLQSLFKEIFGRKPTPLELYPNFKQRSALNES